MRYLRRENKNLIQNCDLHKNSARNTICVIAQKINDSLYSYRRDGVDIGATIKSMKYLRGSCNNS